MGDLSGPWRSSSLTPGGSFLEFQSQFGRKRLAVYARKAELDLEIWDGPLADRWGD